MKTKELKEQIKFEEALNIKLEWKNSDFNSSDFNNILIDESYDDYIVYHCWDNDEEEFIFTFRNKKKNGSELK